MWHLSLISMGEVVQHVAADAYIEVPRKVDRNLAAHAGTSATPSNRVETNTRVVILKHLREAEKDINKVFLVIWRKNMGAIPPGEGEEPRRVGNRQPFGRCEDGVRLST